MAGRAGEQELFLSCVEGALELAARFGARAKGSIGTIKRAVYFGGSGPLARGLDVEGSEFFTRIPTDESQDVMRSYLETMDASGEIPFYIPGAYEHGLDAGDMSGRSGTP